MLVACTPRAHPETKQIREPSAACGCPGSAPRLTSRLAYLAVDGEVVTYCPECVARSSVATEEVAAPWALGRPLRARGTRIPARGHAPRPCGRENPRGSLQSTTFRLLRGDVPKVVLSPDRPRHRLARRHGRRRPPLGSRRSALVRLVRIPLQARFVLLLTRLLGVVVMLTRLLGLQLAYEMEGGQIGVALGSNHLARPVRSNRRTRDHEIPLLRTNPGSARSADRILHTNCLTDSGIKEDLSWVWELA
jgi:hypothetical protein